MASGIIYWLIDKYLSNIIDIKKDLTKSSIFTGEVQLLNLTIKKEITNFLNLPFFELNYGHVGKLRIKVQLPRIHLHPVKVEFENVFIHAKQKNLSNIQKEREIKFMEEDKVSQLQSIEELKNELNSHKDDNNPDMISKLINNVEITVTNICLRIDDEYSYSLTPFSIGVLIKHIKLKTVDKNFKEAEGKYSIPFGEINHKKIEVDNMCIFFDTYENEGKLVDYNQKIMDTANTKIKDEKLKKLLGARLGFYRYCLSEVYEHINNYNSHHYILFNFKIILIISLNENLKNGKPKIELHCNLNDIKLTLNLVQIKAISKLSIYQMLIQKYTSGLSNEYYTKTLTEDEKMEYIDNYIEYLGLMYGKKPNEKKAKAVKEVLNKFENKLKYEEIQVMRNAAESKMKHSEKFVEIDKQLKEMKSDKLFKKKSLKKNQEDELKEKIKQIQVLEKQKLKLENRITSLIKKRLEHIDILSGFFPDDSENFSFIKINLSINEIQINIKRIQEEKLFSIIFNNFILFCDLKNRQQLVRLTIDDISILQYQLPQSKYQYLLTTITQKNEKFNEREKKGKLTAWYMELENNPNNENTNYRINFRNQKRLILIANIFSIQYISKKISDYMTFFMDENFDFPEKYNVEGEIYKLIKDGFKIDDLDVNFQHFNAELNVTIKSPIILFPLDILDNSNKKCIIIRCGDFHVFSLLPPRQDPNIDYVKVRDKQKLFDTYMLKAEQLCVTTLDDFDGDLSGLLGAKGSNLIQDVSFGINVDMMFEKKNPYFEKFKIVMSIGKMNINIRDAQLPFFMEMIEKSGKLIKLAIYELEHKTLFEKKEIKLNKEEEETYNINNKKNHNIDDDELQKKFLEKKKREKREEPQEGLDLMENININESLVKNIRDSLFKEELVIDDPKFIIVNFRFDNLRICIQKTISYEERQILLEAKEEEYKDLKYRDFIVFELASLKVEFLLTEKFNIESSFVIKSINVYDRETLITNANNPKGDSYIEKSFQNIIKMDAGRNDEEIVVDEGHQTFLSRKEYTVEEVAFVSDFNDILNLKNNKSNKENEKDKYEDFFMFLTFTHNNQNKTQLVEIVFKNITICGPLNTVIRIIQFTNYYLDMFNRIIEENIIIWNNMEKEHKREKMKNRLLKKMSKSNILLNTSSSSDTMSLNSSTSGTSDSYYDDDSDDESDSEDNSKIFDSKFASKLASEINKNKEKPINDDKLLIDTSGKNKNIINEKENNNDKKANDDKNAENNNINDKDKDIKMTHIFRTKNKKLNIRVKFEMKEAAILFPLDDSKTATKVLNLKGNIKGNIFFKTDVDLIRNGNDKLVKIQIKENNMKTNIKIISVELNMLNYNKGKFSIDNICDKVLTSFRLCININSMLLLPDVEQTVTLVNLDLEPLVFNVGFTQVRDFIKLVPTIKEFLKGIKAEYDDPIKEIEELENIGEDLKNIINIEKDDEINNINNKEDKNGIPDSIIKNDIINIEEENKKKKDEKKKEHDKIEQYKKRKLSKKKKKSKEKKLKSYLNDKPEINVELMNNTIDLKIHLEKILIKIIDDSGYYLQPLINIEFRTPPIKFILNTNSDSVKNISNLLYESISRKELSLRNYDIKSLALFGQIFFSFSVIFYNNRIDDWEPIIEKYEASITCDQVAWFSRLRILYNSNDMLNLNLSYSILVFLNEFLKKVLTRKSIDSKNISSSISTDIAVEFANSSGININCWLDANEHIHESENDYKFILDSNTNSKQNKKTIKRSKLNEIYNQLTEAQLKIKKDKFSFKLNGFLPVTANDFSSNYTTCFKLKREISDRYEVNENKINIKNKDSKKKNKNKIKNQINNEILLDIKKNENEINNDDNKLLLLNEKLLPGNNNEIEEEDDLIIDTSSNKPKKKNSNKIEDDDTIEIFLKIRKNASLKSIKFGSNIFFYNNLPVPISLSLISEKDFISKYNSNDKNINHENNKDKILLKPGVKHSLSLLYLIKKYRIYVSFHNNFNKESHIYTLLYKDFNDIKLNNENFIKYDEENSPTFKGKKETELKDYYSKVVILKYKNKNYYITSNLIIQRGYNDIIKIEENENENEKNQNINNINNINNVNNVNNINNQEIKIEENNNKSNINLSNENSNEKTFSFLFILSESLVIVNQLPFNIKCEFDVNNYKEVLIKPKKNKYFLDLDIDNTKLKLILKYHNIIFKSKFFDIKTFGMTKQQIKEQMNEDEKEVTIQMFEGVSKATNLNKFIDINIKVEENIENDNYIGAFEKEFEHNVKIFSKKRKIIIYNKCIIINKSDILFYIMSQSLIVDHFSPLKFNGKIYPKSVNLFHTKNVKNAFKMKCDNSNWSEKFNINTIGSVGVISLDINDKDNNVTNLEIGVSINSSWNFPNTLFITIEPRFLLINRFGYDLQYKQYNNKKDKISNDHGKQFKGHPIKNGETLTLNLLRETKNMKNMIQLNMGEYSVDYSCPIDLNEIGDVDVKIPINDEMKQLLLTQNIEIEKEIEEIKRKERLQQKMHFLEEKTNEEKANEDSKIIPEEDLSMSSMSSDNIDNEENKNNSIINNPNNSTDEILGLINTDEKEKEQEKEKELNINIDDNENQINNDLYNINTDINFNPDSEINAAENEDDGRVSDVFRPSTMKKRFFNKSDEKKEISPNEERRKKLKKRKKKLQKVQMRPRKYCIFSQNNEAFLLVRVTKSIKKGLIYIVIFPPENPQYIIRNQTHFPITLSQKEDNFNHEKIILEKGEFLPYVWGDTLKNEKLLIVNIDKDDTEINLNEIKVLQKRMEISREFLVKNNQKVGHSEKTEVGKSFFFQTTIENNKTRTLIVKGKHEVDSKKSSFMERIKQKKKNSFNIKIRLYTKGFGISIINSIPKELYYISLYGFLIESQIFNFNKDKCSHIIANIKMSFKNLQIDYCLPDLFKSMIIPQTQITPQIEELKEKNKDNNNESLVPLFQGIISFHRITNHLISVSSDEFPQLDFTIQPIKLNISNYQLMSLVDLGLQLKEEIDFNITEPEKKNKKFNNIDEFEKYVLDEFSKINDIKEYDPSHYSKLLNTEISVLPEEIIFNSEKNYLFFIKNIALGSLVIILTTRIDLNSIRVIPLIVSGVSSFIGNIFTHITDYNLYLPSLYYTDVFTDVKSLINQLKTAYLSQLKRRIFKIIGSLDILGNPTGYASSISKGFLEIFEAPRKGLIQGPLGLGEVVAKGFGLFLTTVISSSFDIVGKISGTLLASCEELQGIKNIDNLNEREPSNILSGIYYGVKNGILDIGKGVAGIFIKPYEEAKKSGIGGFFQGVGAGLIGAAVSPITAGLRITNNLVVGIKNTALLFNPKLETERFRYPRTILKAIRLNAYDEDEALVRAILDYLEEYEDHEIIYFKQFKYIYPGLQNSISTLILTDKCVMIVYEAKEIVFKLDLDLIKKVEVHKEPNNINIDLIFYLKNDTKQYIVTNDMSLCVDFYMMFENVKE